MSAKLRSCEATKAKRENLRELLLLWDGPPLAPEGEPPLPP